MRRSFAPYIILTILFALFNIFAFVIPTDKTPAFWVAYGFTVIMFGVEVAVLRMTFLKSGAPKELFLPWPLVCIGAMYFGVQSVAFLLFKLFPGILCWIAIVVHSVLFGMALLCIIATQMSRKQISNFDEAHKR